jgi:hypothetical protein
MMIPMPFQRARRAHVISKVSRGGLLLGCLWLLLAGCVPAAPQVIPTARPSATATIITPVPTEATATATLSFTDTPAATGGPSPTPLLGPTRTAAPVDSAPTRAANPNAPVIEFFRSAPEVANPGGTMTLFWSTRNVTQAAIYRLDNSGGRSFVYNVDPTGRQVITLSQRDRVQVTYELVIGNNSGQETQRLVIPLSCPIPWFFAPAPGSCPRREATPTVILEQRFERGRMFYLEDTNTLYVLYNDGSTPAWDDFANRYNPAIHPERDDAFDQTLVGTNFVQPVARLGYVWRGVDAVRNRLGRGLAPETRFDGFTQTAPSLQEPGSGNDDLFIASSDGTVLQILPGGTQWQILTPSSAP